MRVNTLAYGEIEFVGELLSKFFPTTIIYSDSDNTPIVVEWLDENDDEEDLYIMYKCSNALLSSYIGGVINHADLIRSSNEFYHFINELHSEEMNCTNYKSLDSESLPTEDSFFREDVSNDVERIVSFFNLELEAGSSDDYFSTLQQYTQDAGDGLFRIHINEGSFVGHGSMNTRVLGELLVSFEGLYKAMTKDVFGGVSQNPRVLSIAEQTAFNDTSETEVVIKEAASFSLYIKPKRFLRYEDDGVEDSYQYVADEIFGNINSLMEGAKDFEGISLINDSFSPSVFSNIQKFANTVLDNRLAVDLDYYNPNSEFELRNNIKPKDAHGISLTVENSYFEETNEFSFIGKFTLLNTKTGHFQIKAEDDDEFTGYVNESLFELITTFNFSSNYQVIISQEKTSYLSKKRDKYVNILVSCYTVE